MSRPTNTEITEAIKKITTATGSQWSWPTVERKLKEYLRRDAVGTNLPDGYPAGTMGGSGGSPELNSVEGAAMTRMQARKDRDELRRHLERAVGWLNDASAAVGALVHSLEQADKLLGAPVTIHHCECCEAAAAVELEQDLPLRFGTIGDVLERSSWLCQSCYKFGENNRRLPTAEEHERHRTTGKWRLRAS